MDTNGIEHARSIERCLKARMTLRHPSRISGINARFFRKPPAQAGGSFSHPRARARGFPGVAMDVFPKRINPG